MLGRVVGVWLRRRGENEKLGRSPLGREETYSLATLVKSIVDSVGGGAISFKNSLGDHFREVYGVVYLPHVSTLIRDAGAGGWGERREFCQLAALVNSVGTGDIESVGIGGDTEHDLVRREVCSNPSVDTIDCGASLKGRARVTQRRVGTDTVRGPLTLQNEPLDVHLYTKRGHPH